MYPLTTSRKIDIIEKLEQAMTLPKNFFVKNETSIRLCYFIGREIKYIYLPTVEDVACFLKKHGVITFYSYQDDKVKMYNKSLLTLTGAKGEPIQYERMVEFRWSDIDFSAANVLHYAACHEMELGGGIMGMVLNKVLGKKGGKAA